MHHKADSMRIPIAPPDAHWTQYTTVTISPGPFPDEGTCSIDGETFEIRERMFRHLENYLVGILDTGDEFVTPE